MGFYGVRKFRGRNYVLKEVHEEDEIVNKWGIFVEVPGVNHDPQIFTMSVKGVDSEVETGPNDDDEVIKRPALFGTKTEAFSFSSMLDFPDKTLRVIQITPDIVHHRIFDTVGGYLVTISKLIVP